MGALGNFALWPVQSLLLTVLIGLLAHPVVSASGWLSFAGCRLLCLLLLACFLFSVAGAVSDTCLLPLKGDSQNKIFDGARRCLAVPGGTRRCPLVPAGARRCPWSLCVKLFAWIIRLLDYQISRLLDYSIIRFLEY